MPPSNVVADAQFTLAAVLKPFMGFEQRYQGKDPNIPVPFFQTIDGKRPFLDPQANEPGFSPDLMLYLKVPLASTVLVWIPMLGIEVDGVVILANPYDYMVHYRLRSVGDNRRDRSPYHLRDDQPGAPDTAVAPAEARFIIPGATRSLLYHTAEPVLSLAARTDLHREFIRVTAGGTLPNDLSLPRPLLPGLGDRRGDYEQGILDPADFPGTRADAQSIFVPVWFDCEGDELLVTAQRGADLEELWDFGAGGLDEAFGHWYGTGVGTHDEFPAFAIYLFTGSRRGSTPRIFASGGIP